MVLCAGGTRPARTEAERGPTQFYVDLDKSILKDYLLTGP